MSLSPEQLKTQRFWKKRPKLITRELRDIIHGCIISDGSVTPQGSLRVRQSTKQRKWVEWMYQELRTLCTDSGIQDKVMTDTRTQTKTPFSRFYTRALLKGFRSMWYVPDPKKSTQTGDNNFRKVLPKGIRGILCPTVLTLWFAGDGTKIIGRRGAKYEVTNFTVEERLLLQSLLKEKFGLDTCINKAGKSKTGTAQYTLNFNRDTYLKFREYTAKFGLIQSLFPYKLHPIGDVPRI